MERLLRLYCPSKTLAYYCLSCWSGELPPGAAVCLWCCLFELDATYVEQGCKNMFPISVLATRDKNKISGYVWHVTLVNVTSHHSWLCTYLRSWLSLYSDRAIPVDILHKRLYSNYIKCLQNEHREVHFVSINMHTIKYNVYSFCIFW